MKIGSFDIAAGHPFRLGANYEEGGTNFALWSAHATGVELCLFDPLDGAETRLHLPSMEGGIWFGHLMFLAVLLVRPQGLFPKTRG